MTPALLHPCLSQQSEMPQLLQLTQTSMQALIVQAYKLCESRITSAVICEVGLPFLLAAAGVTKEVCTAFSAALLRLRIVSMLSMVGAWTSRSMFCPGGREMCACQAGNLDPTLPLAAAEELQGTKRGSMSFDNATHTSEFCAL